MASGHSEQWEPIAVVVVVVVVMVLVVVVVKQGLTHHFLERDSCAGAHRRVGRNGDLQEQVCWRDVLIVDALVAVQQWGSEKKAACVSVLISAGQGKSVQDF